MFWFTNSWFPCLWFKFLTSPFVDITYLKCKLEQLPLLGLWGESLIELVLVYRLSYLNCRIVIITEWILTSQCFFSESSDIFKMKISHLKLWYHEAPLCILAYLVTSHLLWLLVIIELKLLVLKIMMKFKSAEQLVAFLNFIE